MGLVTVSMPKFDRFSKGIQSLPPPSVQGMFNLDTKKYSFSRKVHGVLAQNSAGQTRPMLEVDGGLGKHIKGDFDQPQMRMHFIKLGYQPRNACCKKKDLVIPDLKFGPEITCVQSPLAGSSIQ